MSESILVVTRNYPPLTGGMERLMEHTVEALTERFDVTLIGPAGCHDRCPNAARVIECPSGPASFLITAMLKGLLHCPRHRYRYVLGGSGLVAPITAVLARICGAKSVVHVHGLDLVADSAIYQRLFVPWISRNNIVIANSRNTRDIAIDKGCEPAHVHVLNPGSRIPDEDQLRPVEPIRKSLGLDEEKVILFVGRIIKRKGLAPFLKHAWPQIVAAEPTAKLLVIGDTPRNALMRDPDEARQLDSTLTDHGLIDSVRFLGTVDDGQLWQCYALADALIFPLIHVKGDVEGFGMVAIEAAACGTPTVAFPVGGVVDAVLDGVNGRLVPEQDYAAFADAVIATIQGEPPTRHQCRVHAENFSWEKRQERLFSIFKASPET